eukprot:3119455-Rhodomonas_salina.1
MTAYNSDGNAHQLILWDTSGRLRFYLNYAGGYLAITTAGQVPLDTWVYVAVVFYGPVVSMYFDGALVGSVTPPGGVLQVDRVWDLLDLGATSSSGANTLSEL